MNTTQTHQARRAAFIEAAHGQEPGFALTEHQDPEKPYSISCYVAFLSAASTGNPKADAKRAPKINAAVNGWIKYGTLPTRTTKWATINIT